MIIICQLLGVKKLNTASYHPQCNGLVERFNRTLKTMLQKHAADFGVQWDRYLPGVLWTYRNTPHDSTGEKPSFLLFGINCRYPTQAALLPPNPVTLVTIEDYQEELVLMFWVAHRRAVTAIHKAQNCFKENYDQRSQDSTLRVGDWVLVKFPQEESGCLRKLSHPWHGPCWVTLLNSPDVTVTKVYPSEDGPLHVHLSPVQPYPPTFPHGFYCYGGAQYASRKIPKRVQLLLDGSEDANPRYRLRRRQPTDGQPRVPHGGEWCNIVCVCEVVMPPSMTHPIVT